MNLPGIVVIAHRGASARAPESTRAAIRLAWTMQADMVELDVQLTADGRAVIFHDRMLDRTSTGKGVLGRRTLAELRILDAGSWFAPRFADERILLATEALRLIPPGRFINLELKATRRRALLVRATVSCVTRTGRAKRTLLSSFDAGLLAELRRQHQSLARALLCHRHPAASLRRAIALGCVAWHPHASLVTGALVRRAHAAGLRVHVWTVDEPATARRLLRLGVDGLFTNRPDRIRPACRESAMMRQRSRGPR